MKIRFSALIQLVGLLFLVSCAGNLEALFPLQDSLTQQIETTPNIELTFSPEMIPTKEPTMISPEPSPTRRFEAHPGLPVLRGVNLGNALDAPLPGAWGVTITETLIRSIAEVGFNAIRVPVRFSAYTGAEPEYTLSDTLLQTVDQVITWGLDEDLTVILDLHHFDALMDSPAAEETRYLAIWEQLASRYQSLPAAVYFELLNEPHGAMDSETWNRLVAESIPLIRRTNPTRTIIIGGVNYSAINFLNGLEFSNDPHLAATFHYYDPLAFTHQGASWVNGAEKWLGTLWTGTPEEVSTIEQAFDRAVDWSNTHNIPLIMGEFGAIVNADSDSRRAWTGTVRQTAEKRGIGWFYWDLCTDFGILDCENKKWDEALLHALIP